MSANSAPGRCLMRDLYGRVGEVQVDLVYPHLLQALRRPPASAEERSNENHSTHPLVRLAVASTRHESPLHCLASQSCWLCCCSPRRRSRATFTATSALRRSYRPADCSGRYPLANYSLDQYFPAISVGLTSGVDASGVVPMIAYFAAQVIWGLTASSRTG